MFDAMVNQSRSSLTGHFVLKCVTGRKEEGKENREEGMKEERYERGRKGIKTCITSFPPSCIKECI